MVLYGVVSFNTTIDTLFVPVMSSNLRKAGNCNIFIFGLLTGGDTFGRIILVALSTVFDVFSTKFVLLVLYFSNFRSLLLYFVKALLLLSSEPAKNATSKLLFEPKAQ